MTIRACTIGEVPPGPVQKDLQDALARLPDRVAAMREKILDAADTGNIHALRPAIERNEVMPLFGKPNARARTFSTAIEFLKAQSFDGEGREVLSLLSAILRAPYTHLRKQPIDMYVWPLYATDEPAARSGPATELYRFSAFADIGKTGANGLPLMHRVEIGADGTWHFFAVE